MKKEKLTKQQRREYKKTRDNRKKTRELKRSWVRMAV